VKKFLQTFVPEDQNCLKKWRS